MKSVFLTIDNGWIKGCYSSEKNAERTGLKVISLKLDFPIELKIRPERKKKLDRSEEGDYNL